MMESLYGYVRAAIGFSLLVSGASFWLAPGSDIANRSFGGLFSSIGGLFCLSAFDPFWDLNVDLSNLFVVTMIYSLSRSLLSLSLFLFGNEKRKGSAKKVAMAGTLVSLALVLLPLLDYALFPGASVTSIEDDSRLGPIHRVAAAAIYILPIAACAFAFALARWKPGDVSVADSDTRIMLGGMSGIALILLATLVSVAVENRGLYRAFNVLLELFILAWYFYVVMHPGAFRKIRKEIGKEHARKLSISDDESALIRKRLDSLVAREHIFSDEALDLDILAKRVGVPAYRLSHWFHTSLGASFSSWLNGLRIEYVKALMAERPDLSILDLALEAGYSSKATFNAQFSRIVGMSPSLYRQGLAEPSMRPDL